VKYFQKFLWCAALILMISCDSSDSLNTDIGKNYFPIQKGHFIIYDVERTTYNLGIPTTRVYELKVAVTDSFRNAQNDYVYVVYRSTRLDDASPWTYLDSWSVRDAAMETIVNEGNLPLVKLKYPVHEGFRWDANLYNTLGEDEVEMTRFQKEIFNDLELPDCLTIVQEDNDDFIVTLDQRKEIYAPHIGLVYKDSTVLNYCTQPECLGEQVVEQGVRYKQTVKAYGVE
jgi:hypothetical protein